MNKKASSTPNCYKQKARLLTGLFLWYIRGMNPQPSNKKSSAGGCLKLILFLVGILVFVAVIEHLFNPSPPKTKAEIRKEQTDALFSAYDGSHVDLEKQIKATMNDPDSYEHVQTSYRDDSTTLYIVTTFRGNNAFGGKITKRAEATISAKDGHILNWDIVK